MADHSISLKILVCDQPTVFCHLQSVRNSETQNPPPIHDWFNIGERSACTLRGDSNLHLELCLQENSVICTHLPTGLLTRWELFSYYPHTDNNVCPTMPLRALNTLLALVKAPQYHPIEAYRHSTNHSAGHSLWDSKAERMVCTKTIDSPSF